MAELKRTCIEGICYDVPEYEAGNGITIAGDDPKIISTSVDFSDYYNKTEIDDIVSAIEVGGFREVDELPQTGEPNYIYLVPKAGGGYERYIYSDGQWLDLGDTDTVYSAGTNIEITSTNVINSLIQSGTNVTVGSNGKVSLNASPALTGTPTAPTNGTASTSNTQIATTAFVQNAINRRLPKSRTQFFGNESSISVANNTTVTWDLWTASAAGTIIGYMMCRFAANATGQRELVPKAAGSAMGNGLRINTCSAGVCTLTVPYIAHFTSGQKAQMSVWQNSGGALAVVMRYLVGIWIPD